MATPSTVVDPPRPEGTAPDAHYNRITNQWESPNDRVEVPSGQTGSTFPGDKDGAPVTGKPSFKDQVIGNAKKFAGKTFGKEHEVAQGEALLAGAGVSGAIKAGEQVKESS
ncbi:hypothetical protein T439DRAFT_326348 [Meredithblackwellia eburnea MCA 4105]